MSRIGKKPVVVPAGVTAKVEGQKVTAQVDPRFPAQVGSPVTVTLDMTQAHFFDPVSEARL